jgi:uncharacterized protein YukE
MANNNQVRFPMKAVETFSITLGSYSQKLDECINDMDNAIKTLANDWKDPKFTEFEREFKVCKDKIKPLSEELTRVKKHAEDKWIHVINEYLNRKIQ